MLYASEPTKTCRICNGKGGWIIDTSTGAAIQECNECNGSGDVQHDHVYEPQEDPYAPDSLKEWEGIA